MTIISKAGLRLLREMKAAEDRDDLDDAEVACDGGICYVGLRRVSMATVNQLLRLCLISTDDYGRGVERFTLNEEGRAMADDPEYRPKILALYRKGEDHE